MRPDGETDAEGGGGAAAETGLGGAGRSDTPSGGASAASSGRLSARGRWGAEETRTGGGGGREASITTGIGASTATGLEGSVALGREGSGAAGRTESVLGRPMPSLARRSAAGGGLERGPGASDAGLVQAEAPLLAIGCDFSPPTTIIGDCSARMPVLEGDSGPNGLEPLVAAGFGGGASLRAAGGSEDEDSEGSTTAGIVRVAIPSSTSLGSSPLPGPAAAFCESWGSSIVIGS